MTMGQELSRKIVTARKQHTCSLCTGRIHAGDKYERATIVHDGCIYDFLTCAPCIDDNVMHWVYTHWWGRFEDGIGEEDAYEWATELVAYSEGSDPVEVNAAKRYLARRNN